MIYTEIDFKISPLQPASEILIAELGELGFESFVEEEDGLKAYFPGEEFDTKVLKELFVMQNPEFNITYQIQGIENINWNAKWESDYESVLIDNRCYIRAPFHKTIPDIEFEIEIEPKMSFGTAHHETTSQMISLLLKEDVEDKDVLDMGCGTAVLAILAKMKNAKNVHAIDNDEWAYNNSVENVGRNNFQDIIVEQGDAALLKNKSFDVILANINKNILLADMEAYSKSLNAMGVIMFSGFYINDLEDIKAKAYENGLVYIKHIDNNNWVAAKFSKK